jgi:hypothetical protein
MEIITACVSLPLNLEISGSYLRDICDLEIWKGALRDLKGGRDIIGSFENEMFCKTLQISYDCSFSKNQYMFWIYICWFFKNAFCLM